VDTGTPVETPGSQIKPESSQIKPQQATTHCIYMAREVADCSIWLDSLLRQFEPDKLHNRVRSSRIEPHSPPQFPAHRALVLHPAPRRRRIPLRLVSPLVDERERAQPVPVTSHRIIKIHAGTPYINERFTMRNKKQTISALIARFVCVTKLQLHV
jgi:hypothetical protein